MKRKVMEKKRRFQYCTAVMATMLLVSANGISATAQESGNTKTVQSSIYLKPIDSGGSQKFELKQNSLMQTVNHITIAKRKSTAPQKRNHTFKNASAEENSDTIESCETFENTSTEENNDAAENSNTLENNPAEEHETTSYSDNAPENTETKISETETFEIEATETEIFEIEATETETFEIKATETEIFETDTIVTDADETETNKTDTETSEAETTETEIVETSPTDGSDTVETESDPNSTENGDSCICDIRCRDNSVNQNCPVCGENFADCTATITIDLIETPVNENVVWFCSFIDSLPTAEQLYAEAPDPEDEHYSIWLSETKEILLQISELQEQYRLFSEEDKAYIGADRKSKLDALGEMAGKLLEDDVVYAVDINFSDDKGLFYEVLKDNNSQVQIVSYGNYISALENSLEIPSQVADENNNYYTVVSIGERAFSGCSNLTNVSIPNSVKNINTKAFLNCTNLETITVSENITINDQAFSGCSKLSTLKIKMNSNEQISPIPVYDIDVFNGCPLNRNIVFQTTDGTELTDKTTPRLVTAFNAYRTVDDGNTNDDLWYGWKLKTPTFTVTPIINKDDAPWSDHNRIFALKMPDSEELITDLTAVKNGTYTIVDITTDSNNPLDTGVSVTVNDDDTNNDQPINYYTVTFYDPDNAYDNNTAQTPQIILKDQLAVEPSAPEKEGFTFNGWKTAKENGQPFDFESTKITTTTSIYASWIDDAKQEHKVTIKVRLNDTEWTDHSRTFMLKGSDNSLISPEHAVDGDYRIIDTTNGELDTDITVTVTGSDAQATVDYYTVTFYSDNKAVDTQNVLKGQTAETPPEPSKEGFTFVKWKTSQDGDTEFDFTTPINSRTDIYADWSTETYYTITPSKEGNGSISPDTETKVKSGSEITFTFTPEKGYHIKEVLVDNTVTQTSGNTYTFTNVTENHTIKVIFEADDPNDKDDNPGDNPGGDDDKPGDNPGGDDDKPSDNPSGDDDKPSDNPGGDDDKPSDNPGGDDDKPSDNPSGDDDKPGDNPGGDDDKPSDNPSGDDNKPDDNNKPDNDNKPSDDNNKPNGGNTPTTGAENSSGNSNLNDSSPTSSSTVSSTASNPAAVGTMPSTVNIAPNSIDPNATIPNDITDSAYITTGTIASEGTFSDSAKDAEPQTGEAYGIELYALLAIIASIILLLLQLLETRKRKNTIPTGRKEESWQPPLNTPIPCCKALPQKQRQNNLIFNYQEIKKKPAKLCLLSIMQNFKHWHTKQQNNSTLNLIFQQHFQQNHYKILGVIWTKRKQYFCLSG